MKKNLAILLASLYVASAGAQPLHPSACQNVLQAWKNAEAQAKSGQVGAAYRQYLQLFAACTDKSELVGTAWKAASTLPLAENLRLQQEPLLAQPHLAPARYVLALQAMYAANRAGRFQEALKASRSIRNIVLQGKDTGALEVSGWLEQKDRQFAAAENLFYAALRLKASEGARKGLTLALLAEGRLGLATVQANKLSGPDARGLRAKVLLARAQQALKEGKAVSTLALLDKADTLDPQVSPERQALRAWALRAAGQSASAKVLFAQLHQVAPADSEYQSGLLETAIDTHDYPQLEALARGTGTAAQRARQVLAQRFVSQGRFYAAESLTGTATEGQGSTVSGLFDVAHKSGAAGQGLLHMQTTPEADVLLKLTQATTLALEVTHLNLDNGLREVNADMGRLQVTSELRDARMTAQARVSSVGIGLTGSVGYRQYRDEGYLDITASRAALTDSVRAFAGEVLPDGTVIGPAVKSGVVLQGHAHLPAHALNLDWQGETGVVTASGLAANRYWQADAALTKDVQQLDWSWLNFGPEVRLGGFERDENRFDGAHGGYFSPKSDIETGLKFNALSAEGKTTLFKANGRIGYASRNLYNGRAASPYLESDAMVGKLVNHSVIGMIGVGFQVSPGYRESHVWAGFTVPLEKRTGLRAADLKVPEGQ